MHDDASGPKADALDLRLDQGSVLKGSIVRVCGPECIDDYGFDLRCRDPRDRSGLAPAALGEHRRDIVAIAEAALLGRARRHLVAAVVEDAADQESRGGGTPHLGSVAIGRELLLDGIKHGAGHDGSVLAGIARTLVIQLAKVDPVPEDVGQRSIGQGHASDGPARAERPLPRHDPALPQLALQGRQRAEGEIALEDQPDSLGLVLSDQELALTHLIAERDDAADPDAPALGCGKLVADALACDLPLRVSLPMLVVVLKDWVTET